MRLFEDLMKTEAMRGPRPPQPTVARENVRQWPANSIEVAVVESDDRIRRYLTAIVGGTMGMLNCWDCAGGKTALEHIARRPPTVVVVSLFLRDMTGTQLIVRTRQLFGEIPFLLLLPDTQPNLFVEALETGACAYVSKTCGADELICAIRTISDGGAVVADAVAKTVVDFFRARGSIISRLTERERQVLVCLCNGNSHSEAAKQLGIDRETVRTHVRNLLAKVDAHSTAEAIARYLNPSLKAPKRNEASPIGVFRENGSVGDIRDLRGPAT